MKAPRSKRAGAKASRGSIAGYQELTRNIKFDARTITLAIVVIFGMLVVGPQVQLLYTQQQNIADMQAQLNQAKQDLKTMETERKRWEDPVYIRAQARDRLYYVMPGEVSYLVMDASGVNQSDTSGTVGATIAARTNNGEISTSVKATNNNWVNNLLETVVRTGVEEPVVKKN